MIVECPGCASRYDVTGRPPGTKARCRCGTVFVLPEPAKSAGQLSCPSCAANVPSTDHVCTFCSAALKIKACPRCFAKIFHESKHCNRCGAKVDRPAETTQNGEARVRACPRCTESPLEARLVADVLLDECPACHGVFLDSCAVERVVRERRQASAKALVTGAQAETNRPLQPSGPLYIKCPDCDQVMNRVNFGRRSGVIIDVCKPHGTWFDADELPRVIDFVMSGGLEESARRDAAQLRSEARAARSEARGGGAFAHSGTSDWGSFVGSGSADVDTFGGLLSVIGRILR